MADKEFDSEKFRKNIEKLFQKQDSNISKRPFIAGKKTLQALFDNHTKKELEQTLDRVEIITNSEGAEYIKQKLGDN